MLIWTVRFDMLLCRPPTNPSGSSVSEKPELLIIGLVCWLKEKMGTYHEWHMDTGNMSSFSNVLPSRASAAT